MKTIYLRQKRSGNFEISNRKAATHKFKNEKEFKEWYRFNSNKIIKATYRKSQTYFRVAEEVIAFVKNAK